MRDYLVLAGVRRFFGVDAVRSVTRTENTGQRTAQKASTARSRGFARVGTSGSRGFTLIELLAVTAIIVLISAVVLADNNRFGGTVLLENLSYDIALTVRQAQVYGIAVTGFKAGGTNAYGYGYGMHFDVTSPMTYILFADTAQTGVYSAGISPSEIVQQTNIQRGYGISKLCAPAGNDSATCNAVNSLDILFKRPEPDAYISGNGAPTFQGGQVISNALNSSARIVLRSPRGDTRSVVVQVSGEIAVQSK
jgi:prepilin-type N-terminal cleavage/methylation domain-containing protein